MGAEIPGGNPPIRTRLALITLEKITIQALLSKDGLTRSIRGREGVLTVALNGVPTTLSWSTDDAGNLKNEKKFEDSVLFLGRHEGSIRLEAHLIEVDPKGGFVSELGKAVGAFAPLAALIPGVGSIVSAASGFVGAALQAASSPEGLKGLTVTLADAAWDPKGELVVELSVGHGGYAQTFSLKQRLEPGGQVLSHFAGISSHVLYEGPYHQGIPFSLSVAVVKEKEELEALHRHRVGRLVSARVPRRHAVRRARRAADHGPGGRRVNPHAVPDVHRRRRESQPRVGEGLNDAGWRRRRSPA